MAFGRNKTKTTAFGVAPVKAATASVRGSAFLGYSTSTFRTRALQVPAFARSRDLIVSLIGSLPLNQYSLQWIGESYEEIQIPSEPWMAKPDPNTTRQFTIAGTVDDLLFHGRAFWLITRRYSATNLPAAFQWLPADEINTPDQAGPRWFGTSNDIEFQGVKLNPRDVVQFLSPFDGLQFTARTAIDISERLDQAARRFASNEIAAGYIKIDPQTEPYEPEELVELAAEWSRMRRENSIGALQGATWVEFSSDPSKLQLVEARSHAMLTIANMVGVPPYLIGAPTGSSMTYQNAELARRDLWTLGAAPIAHAISETLSQDHILPRGRFCRLDFTELVDTNDSPNLPTEQGAPDASTASL